jgi:hypothetical protein
MSEVWNKVYASDASFFGENPTNFALDCYEEFKKDGVNKILELGCEQGVLTTVIQPIQISVSKAHHQI